jgi:hypothetical protein
LLNILENPGATGLNGSARTLPIDGIG